MNTNNSFKESVFELAFGDNAMDKGYTEHQVLCKLREFSNLTQSNNALCNNSEIEFTLHEEAVGDELSGKIDLNSDLGISLYFEGHGDSQDSCFKPVYIEKYDGEVKVRIYSDIKKEEPTHNVSLEGARLTKREPESGTICNGDLEPYEGEIRVGLWPVIEDVK